MAEKMTREEFEAKCRLDKYISVMLDAKRLEIVSCDCKGKFCHGWIINYTSLTTLKGQSHV